MGKSVLFLPARLFIICNIEGLDGITVRKATSLTFGGSITDSALALSANIIS